MTLSEIEQIRARHRPFTTPPVNRPVCIQCAVSVGPACDASLLLAALSEAEADVKQADEDYARFYRHWKDRVTAAEARLEALEGALRWYADKTNWNGEHSNAGWHHVDRKPRTELDRGDIARAALAQAPDTPDEPDEFGTVQVEAWPAALAQEHTDG